MTHIRILVSTVALVGAFALTAACTPEEIRAAIEHAASDGERQAATDPVCSTPFVACAARPIVVDQDAKGDPDSFTLDGCVLGYENRTGATAQLWVTYGPTQYPITVQDVAAGATVAVQLPTEERVQAFQNNGAQVEVYAAGC